jgi:hypothetical protein
MRNAFFCLALVLGSASGFAQDAAAPERFSARLPSLSWGLELGAPGFVVKANEMQSDGRRYFLAKTTRLKSSRRSSSNR